MTVCAECGSDKVQTLQWVEVNSKKPISEESLISTRGNWCPNCEDHVTFKEVNQ